MRKGIKPYFAVMGEERRGGGGRRVVKPKPVPKIRHEQKKRSVGTGKEVLQ